MAPRGPIRQEILGDGCMNYPITFGKYLLLERVNIGGMAEVYKAKAFGVEGFERILAIKRILPNMADDDEFINMFVDEARIAVQLSHANIVQIYELGKFETQYYIAMEYVSGKDLRQILDRLRKKGQTLPVPAAAFLAGKVCDGLDYAHRKIDPSGRPMHVIHRDVSPQNILVSFEGAVKITDFGIAKAEDRASKTQAGVLKGKFGYMSPEQVRGLEIDHRSDIFAVGILLYEMLTGQRLFVGESDFSTLEKVRNAEVVPPRDHNPAIPEELEAIMLRALSRDRDVRYGWASELHDDLQQYLIEDNAIYNAKRLASLMKEEYQEEIEAEMQSMEEFMRLQPPSSIEAQQASEAHQAASRPATSAWQSGEGEEDRSERTMIFESGFDDLAEAPTQIGEGFVATSAGTASTTGLEHMPKLRSGAKRVQPSVSTSLPHRRVKKTPKTLGVVFAGGVAFLSLLILILAIAFSGEGSGVVQIRSSPTQSVEIYLDDKLVGTRTPLELLDVPIGEHLLRAQAIGYGVKLYKFDLVAGSPARIDIELEKEVKASRSDAIVSLVTRPSQVTVKIGGEIKGVTPTQLYNQDPTQTIIVEMSKEGYQTDVRSITFSPEEIEDKLKTVFFELKPQGESATQAQRPPEGNASIVVDTEPSGAMLRAIRPVQQPVPAALYTSADSWSMRVSGRSTRVLSRRLVDPFVSGGDAHQPVHLMGECLSPAFVSFVSGLPSVSDGHSGACCPKDRRSSRVRRHRDR